MPGRVTAHGMSSSVIVFAGPCVMMRCGGGSAFGSGSFAGAVAVAAVAPAPRRGRAALPRSRACARAMMMTESVAR